MALCSRDNTRSTPQTDPTSYNRSSNGFPATADRSLLYPSQNPQQPIGQRPSRDETATNNSTPKSTEIRSIDTYRAVI